MGALPPFWSDLIMTMQQCQTLSPQHYSAIRPCKEIFRKRLGIHKGMHLNNHQT